MQLQAITHIPLSKDAYMLDEKTLTIRLKAAKGDINVCSLFYGDRVCTSEHVVVEEVVMKKIASDQLFDYFEGKIETSYSRVCYYFCLKDVRGEEIYFSEYGFSKKMECCRTQYFQFPYLHRKDLIQMPEWTKDMVMYHIFPDSFADSKEHISGRGKEIGTENGIKCESKNGGTIKGIIDNLDYIEELQVNCLYLNPIFKAASYHKYDTVDYMEIDPCFGKKEDLKELVAECHSRGIRVILDGVFNHCGSGFPPFQDVLKKGEKSRYCSWFYELRFPVKYDTIPNYEAFAYVKEMPKLDTGNQEVINYFCEVGCYWIREADIDGWRLDVANEINHDFWRTFRKAVREEKDDVFLIGEIWEDSTAWLMGDQFDSTMNYSFSYICREFFAEKKISVSEFDQKIHRMNLRYPEMVAKAQMNFLDTHDVPRFLSYCEGDIRKLKLAVFYMMCAVGIPSVFYGDECGIEGFTEDEYRKLMPWNHNEKLVEFYRRCICIRRNSDALCQGDYETLLCEDAIDVYVFARKTKEETVVVIINAGEKTQKIKIPDDPKAEWRELMLGEERHGNLIVCEEMSGMILKRCNINK